MFLWAIVIVSVVLRPSIAQKQPDYGSVNFEYLDAYSKAAAEKLQDILVSGDSSLSQFMDQMKTSNSALTALKTYEDTEASAKGTKCYIGGQDETRFAKSPQEILRALQTCFAFVSFDDRETLKSEIVKVLKKIQTLDDNRKLYNQLCISLRVPPSQSCVDGEKKSKDGIAKLVTPQEISKYQALWDLTKTKQSIGTCFTLYTKKIQDQLAAWTKQIKDCQASLKQ